MPHADGSPAPDDAIRYAYYLRLTRGGSPAAVALPVLAMIVALVYAVTGPTPVSTVGLLAFLGILGAARVLALQPRGEVGAALTDDAVVIGRFPSDTRTIPRARISEVRASDRPYLGGALPGATSSWVVPKLRYLTIKSDDGVYNVAFDAANIYADHVYDVLRGERSVVAPTDLVAGRNELAARTDRKPTIASPAHDARTPAMESARPVSSSSPASGPAGADRRGAEIEVETRLWESAVARHDDILVAYYPYESDPELLLTYPAMSDISVSETAAFIDALGEATALRTETFPGPGPVASRYREAVKVLANAWATAERRAKRAGTSLLEPGDRKRLDQAAKLLRHADGASTAHERASYLRQVKSIVDDLVRVGAIVAPPKVLLEIETATAHAIEAADS